MIPAFHSFWSAPNLARSGGQITFPDYEMLTAILSALKWKEHSGPIKLITDSRGAEFFRSLHMESLWDEIDTSLDGIDHMVDPIYFWAAGKLYALKTMPTPCVMLDTDLIIWKKPPIPEGAEVCAAHFEPLNPSVYPDPTKFHLMNGYQYPSSWDFTLPASNTAFLYMKDSAFRDTYVEEALKFFRNVSTDGLNPVTAMCFAEQRTLPMCAKAEEVTLSHLVHPANLGGQDFMTHTWGLKTILGQSEEARHQFCMRCVRRIALDFPDSVHFLRDNPMLADYYREYLASVKTE